MKLYQITDQIKDFTETLIEKIKEEATLYQPNETNAIASNCLAMVYVGKERDFIMVESQHIRAMEYFGGFEYVEDECKTRLGDYMFYSINDEDNRVEEFIEQLEENRED